MELRKAFAIALRQARVKRGLTQEDFSVISSRTYLSSLERGIKNPTLEKIDSIAAQLQIHPATLIVLTYLQNQQTEDETQEDLLNQIAREIEELSEVDK